MITVRSRDVPLEPADPATFAGRASVRRASSLSPDEATKAFWVTFEPGARTNWHMHSGIQLLFVVEGIGRVQKWGEPVREIQVGDTVAIAPHEKHWHGAAPGSRMTHVAVNLEAMTSWLEAVTEEQYRAPVP